MQYLNAAFKAFLYAILRVTPDNTKLSFLPLYPWITPSTDRTIVVQDIKLRLVNIKLVPSHYTIALVPEREAP